jgi:hypothetical protein
MKNCLKRCMRAIFPAIWVFILPIVDARGAIEDGEEGGVDRSAWRYTDKGQTITINAVTEKHWTAQRSDGKKPYYLEVGRTEEFIELQNQETKLFVRLHADRAFWRRPKDETWTRWVKGTWVQEPGETQTASKESSAELPAAAERTIRIAYFVPKDRKPVKKVEEKISVIASIVSDLYAQDLARKGFKGAGIHWESKAGQPVVHRIAGQREAAYYNNAPVYNANEQWRRLMPEIKAQLGDPRRQLLVVFAETYDDGPSDVLWPGVLARGAYYSADGGLAIYSSHLLRDELCATTIDEQRKLFSDTTPVAGRKAWGHKMNSPRCEFAEDGFGAVAHELGHALGLPHDRRQDDRDIMGNGFRNLRRNFEGGPGRMIGFSQENAWLIMSSRYVARDLKMNDQQPPRVEVSLQTQTKEFQTVRVKASDNSGLRAIVFFDRAAGSILTGRKLSGKSQQVVEKLPMLGLKTKPLDVEVIVTDDGGNQTRSSLPD